MDDYAFIDNELAKSQLSIGESSNLAQLCQTYACNFTDQKYQDYVCILSVLAQVCIDSAKRRFDIDVQDEIARIKKDMEVSEHGYPKFWSLIRKGFNKKLINKDLHCPMNYMCEQDYPRYRSSRGTIPMSAFFKKHPLEKRRKQCRKVEELISKYSLELEDKRGDDLKQWKWEDYLLLRSDFDELIEDIRKTYISSNYEGLFSWLIDRAFCITPRVQVNAQDIVSRTNKNRPILLKTLYTVNPESFLKCFKTKEEMDS